MAGRQRSTLAQVVACALVAAAALASAALAAPVKWTTYVAPDGSFSLTLPEGYTANPAYAYDQLGAGKTIAGTSFTIPERIHQGSNLSADTYLSVETIPDANSCRADLFLPEGATLKRVTDRGVAYSVATMEDAGAGNFYDQIVYALAGSSPCTAIRYSIHSTNIGNYDPGTVEAFNRAALIGQFDKIRRSLKLAP